MVSCSGQACIASERQSQHQLLGDTDLTAGVRPLHNSAPPPSRHSTEIHVNALNNSRLEMRKKQDFGLVWFFDDKGSVLFGF